MADYLPLISRAVDGLEKNTGENRRALYERARAALVNQLRGVEPPLEEAEITRERLALEEAIRNVETEAAKRVDLDETPAPSPPAREGSSFLRDKGLRDFRQTVGEVDELGDAAAVANRSARETYEHVTEELSSPSAMESRAQDHVFEPPAAESARRPQIAPQPAREKRPEFKRAPVEVKREAAAEKGRAPAHADHAYEEEGLYARPPRDYSRIIKIALALLLVVSVAALGYWQRGHISSMVARLHRSPSSTTRPQPAQPATKPKIADRVGPSSNDRAPGPANAPAVAVAQKVVLYEEDPGNPQGKRFVGSAVWRTETVSPGAGLAPELALRADVEIPERHMRMTWSLRRNTDKALPASHTIEVMFTLPNDFAEGGVGNVPGVLMKESEQARGVPLAGLAVKVTNGYFLVGLSAVDVDKQRNVQLLKERDWFDIPIVYTSGKRAILALEKGTPGARAFEEAFRAWGE